MAPRSGPRVRIVSPNSGTVMLSRSASVHSSRSCGTNASTSSALRSAPLSPSCSLGYHVAGIRQPLQSMDGNLSTTTLASRGDIDYCSNANSSGFARGAGHASVSSVPSHNRRQSHQRAAVRGDREEDRDAVQRAQELLESAGQNVLRKPFGGRPFASGPKAGKEGAEAHHPTSHAALEKASAGALGNTSGSHNNGRHPTAQQGTINTERAIQLPSSIVGLYRPRSRSHSSFRSSSANTSRASSFSGKRPRSQPRGGAQPAMPLNKRASANTSTNGVGIAPSSTPSSLAAGMTRDDGSSGQPPQQSVCPGMFFGLSAIALSERLFDTSDARPTDFYPSVGSQQLMSVSNDLSGYSGMSIGCPRRCARPLWSLVGTFKTALSSVVNVDYTNDSLNWQQRNPKGGYQRIRIPLHAVLDAVCARITQEDEDVQERQFTVIVRTSARPSQAVFGFRNAREANEFRAMVRPQGMNM